MMLTSRNRFTDLHQAPHLWYWQSSVTIVISGFSSSLVDCLGRSKRLLDEAEIKSQPYQSVLLYSQPQLLYANLSLLCIKETIIAIRDCCSLSMDSNQRTLWAIISQLDTGMGYARLDRCRRAYTQRTSASSSRSITMSLASHS